MHGDSRHVETALKGLWEKARRAGELIAQLREENSALQSRVDALQDEVRKYQQELAAKEQMLAQASAGAEAKRGVLMVNGEREALATKVKDLLAKIEAYL
jgi:predicted RNase H-like nuclease (RuvC/YqgF family)